MAHTPGPWKAYVGRRPSVYAEGYGNINLLTTRNGFQKGTSPRGLEQAKADANLIAAAPELLEALKEMLDLYIWDSDASDRAKAVIAKAEGRQC